MFRVVHKPTKMKLRICTLLCMALGLAVSLCASTGCSSAPQPPDPMTVCTPGASSGCFGADSCSGMATCADDGSFLGACVCASTTPAPMLKCLSISPGTVGEQWCRHSACNMPATPFFCPSSFSAGDNGQLPGECFATEREALASCDICLPCAGIEQEAIYAVGAMCGDNNLGKIVCAEDEKTILLCGVLGADGNVGHAAGTDTGATFTRAGECPASQACRTVAGVTSVGCGLPDSVFNVTFAIEGTPCAAERGAACSFDYSLALVCDRGVWQQSHVCGTGVTHCDIITPGHTGCPESAQTGCIGCLSGT